ncbi:hypothetical protein Taro_027504 [Colocasia esculenta]|uniref:Chlororespiratory reduction 4 n=1 Tax=Colocasia esculenta TaxID=4460 RepID=A0A843VUH5_COLES|nr:hypothetical protein [Colocasia esculenta]
MLKVFLLRNRRPLLRSLPLPASRHIHASCTVCSTSAAFDSTVAGGSHHASTAPPPRLSLDQRDVSTSHGVARSNWMITQLCRDGKLAEARRLFDAMSSPDVVSWTSMISGYVRCGMIREAGLLFDNPAAKKNVVTWTAMLSGYVRSKRISEAEELFHKMPEKNVVSWNTMVAGYADNRLIDEACDLFGRMPMRNVVSWNTILTALSQTGRVDDALRLFDRMPEKDVISWTAMLTGLAQNGRIDEARSLFDEMPKRNIVSWNAMISGYAQNLRLDEALQLFEMMPERDLPSWNTMITGFIQNGELRRARDLFDRMQGRNVITWTTLITGYAQEGQGEEALKVFFQMQRDGINPNQATFVSVLAAVSDLAGLGEGKQIHQRINKTIFQYSPFVESALISMYSKCGEIGTARLIFDGTEQRDLVSWNAIVAAYAFHGCGREAIQLFEEMRKSGFKPDGATYVAVLSACSHSGLVGKGLNLFTALLRDESIEVKEDHYACLVDLCGRAGRLDEAARFIDGLEVGSSSACVWGALLAGCNVHGNVKIGKLAARKLLRVEPGNAGTYLLMSNIYASAGKWKDAARVRLRMKDKGLKKQPGCSWIEVGNRVHVFTVRDKSHSEAVVIYDLLQDLHHKMKLFGYIPDIDCAPE